MLNKNVKLVDDSDDDYEALLVNKDGTSIAPPLSSASAAGARSDPPSAGDDDELTATSTANSNVNEHDDEKFIDRARRLGRLTHPGAKVSAKKAKAQKAKAKGSSNVGKTAPEPKMSRTAKRKEVESDSSDSSDSDETDDSDSSDSSDSDDEHRTIKRVKTREEKDKLRAMQVCREEKPETQVHANDQEARAVVQMIHMDGTDVETSDNFVEQIAFLCQDAKWRPLNKAAASFFCDSSNRPEMRLLLRGSDAAASIPADECITVPMDLINQYVIKGKVVFAVKIPKLSHHLIKGSRGVLIVDSRRIWARAGGAVTSDLCLAWGAHHLPRPEQQHEDDGGMMGMY